MDSAQVSQGAYGERITGIGQSASLGRVPAGWPAWRVSVEVVPDPGGTRREYVDDEGALLRFGDGSVAEARRAAEGADVHLRLAREVSDDDIAHPYLAVVGMISAYWRDRLPFHAGAAGINGKAWLVMAQKAGGKSTTLALLEAAGYSVLADDLSVIDAELKVHRGPRFIDLRKEAAEALGVGEPVGVLGVRERWRHRIGDAPLSLPLGGIVIPRWGRSEIQPVSGADRISLLAPGLALRVPGEWAELFMDVVSSVPVLTWTRPHSLREAGQGLAQLIESKDLAAR